MHWSYVRLPGLYLVAHVYLRYRPDHYCNGLVEDFQSLPSARDL